MKPPSPTALPPQGEESGRSFSDDWKVVILQRWAGEFPPAGADEGPEDVDIVLKSSEEIADDLRGAGSFTADEVSAYLAVNGYRIVFDAGYPKWVIKTGNEQLRIEN